MDHLAPVPYATTRIIIKKSPGSATTTPSTTLMPGVVTIAAAGSQSYFLGDEIQFSGTNTGTYKTYLFITGPGLAVNGSQIQKTDPGHSAVENGNPDTFKQMDVQGDHTWSWKWGTSNIALDAGTYTIYAVARPYDKYNLEKTPWGMTRITIKKSPESTTTSPSTTIPSTTSQPTATAIPNPSAPIATPPTSPGYSALIALTGLGAVAFIFIRRH